MSLFKMSAGHPAGVDFEALKAAAGFQRKVTRLRDLRPEEENLFLPPSLENQAQGLAESEVLLAPLPPLLEKTKSTASPSSEVKQVAPDSAVLAEQLRQKKASYRLEKLKDFQYLLQQLLQRLGQEPVSDTSRHWAAVKTQLLGLQSQLSLPYTGKTALSEQEGMALLRPFLQRQSQKLECLRLNKMDMMAAVLAAEARILEKLRAPNPLPALEKAALFSLAESLTRVVQQLWEKTAPPEDPADTPVSAPKSVAQQLPDLPEDLEPEQLESRIFALRSQLQRCSDAEKASLQAQLQSLFRQQNDQAQALHLDAAVRLQRSLDQMCKRLIEIHADLAGVTHESLCRQLHRDALLLKNRCLSELRQNTALGTAWPPLRAGLLLVEKRLGYFQALQEAPALSSREQADFQLPESWPESAERESLAQLLQSLQSLSQSFLALRSALALAQRRTRALSRQAALEKIENNWDSALLEVQSWEKALNQMGQLLKLGRPLAFPASATTSASAQF
ncbi:MAG: hypothetical protein AB7I41_02815 [Candidatus Sericytochromatia bacterium]